MNQTPSITMQNRRPAPRPGITHAIFDMDGTLSWLRHGWPEMMYQLFRQYYPAQAHETQDSIHNLLMSDIISLNGKQTIFQMIRFQERVLARGSTCPAPEELLHRYQSELDAKIEQRSQLIRTGQVKPDAFVVHGARAFLQNLQQRRITLIILSGTIEHRVRAEAELLGLAPFFGKHIYGGTLDHSQFSKKLVIDRLLQEESISGAHLLSLGDGPVEIAETKRVGGMAIGVASDEEHNGSGQMDCWKQEQLLAAGADALIADFRDPDQLSTIIFGT